MGWIGWRPTSHRLIARAWKGLSLGSRNGSCLETYELLDKSTDLTGAVLLGLFGCRQMAGAGDPIAIVGKCPVAGVE